jgi:predicted nucleotide-binding protein (sugar kinase/HSP70/actin superfamily)
MLPTTSGPCRFGKYPELVREFLDREGFDRIPVVGPSARTDYTDLPLPERFTRADRMKMQKILFKGIKASALLEDTVLRFRPYAVDKREVQDLKMSRLQELEAVAEKGATSADLVEWARETVRRFQAVRLRDHQRFPLVLYIGEIYMRQHDPYTDYVIERLEEQGLEIIRDPITEWLEYINRKRQRDAKRDLKLRLSDMDVGATLKLARKYAKYLLKGRYMSSVDGKLAEPFHEVLDGRHVLPGPMEIIEALEARHEYHASIEGESPLSIGIAYHVMHELIPPRNDAYISGVFHVGPFTCMQEGVATAKMEAMAKELQETKGDLLFPIVHAFFGDSPNPNLDAEIAVFAEQCYHKRDMLIERHG